MQIAESRQGYSVLKHFLQLLRLIVTIPEGEKNEQEAWPHLA
jgi:hypothetical protein